MRWHKSGKFKSAAEYTQGRPNELLTAWHKDGNNITMDSKTLKRKQEFRKIIILGKNKGSLDYNNIANLLPDNLSSEDRIELVVTALKGLNIKVIDSESNLTELQILKIVKSSGVGGIKAKDIVKKLTISITKKDVNRILYFHLKKYVQHNDLHEWSEKK